MLLLAFGAAHSLAVGVPSLLSSPLPLVSFVLLPRNGGHACACWAGGGVGWGVEGYEYFGWLGGGLQGSLQHSCGRACRG